eukprot:Em0001g2721a
MARLLRGFEGEFYCKECNEVFHYKSRLERHIQSSSHKAFVDAMERQRTSTIEAYQEPLTSTIEYAEEDFGVEDAADSDEFADKDFEDLVKQFRVDEKMSYYPFPSKIFALLYILIHGPHPIGNTALMFIWFILKECGIKVPSLSTVRAFKVPGVDMPQRHSSTDENPYYSLSLTSIIHNCLQNPEISSCLARFPVRTEGDYTEIYHGKCWNENPRFATPMVSLPHGEGIFVRDWVYFHHNDIGMTKGVVLSFFKQGSSNELHVEIEPVIDKDAFINITSYPEDVYFPEDCGIILNKLTIHLTQVSHLAQPSSSLIKWDGSKFERLSSQDIDKYLTPHPLKEKASGRPVIMVPLILFCDDTSGNRSKKWHKFDCWYLLLAGLPRHENSKVSNIHFVCCSDKVTPLEMSQQIVSELNVLETTGIEVYDASACTTALVIAPLILIICDNPRASELLGHLGSTALKYCRICMADKNDSPTIVCEQRNLMQAQMQTLQIELEVSEYAKTEVRKRFGLREITNNPWFHFLGDIFL